MASQQKRLEDQLRIHTRRRDVLENQLASYGANAAPPHIILEIEDLNEKISSLHKDLSQLPLTDGSSPSERTSLQNINWLYVLPIAIALLAILAIWFVLRERDSTTTSLQATNRQKVTME